MSRFNHSHRHNLGGLTRVAKENVDDSRRNIARLGDFTRDLGARPYMVDKVEISWVIGSLGLANVTGLIILFEEKYLEDNRDVADEIGDPHCATSLSRLY